MTERLLVTPASADDQYDALSEQLAPKLREVLEAAGPGHRLRVTTLPEPVMERLAVALDNPALAGPRAQRAAKQALRGDRGHDHPAPRPRDGPGPRILPARAADRLGGLARHCYVY